MLTNNPSGQLITRRLINYHEKGMVMAKILYVKANPKPEQSRTFQISETFIQAYMEHNPGDEIITLDLYKEGISWLKADDIKAAADLSIEEQRQHPVLKYAYQFAEADKYVFAEPMWNLSVPAILKGYFDYVCVSGITFKYTAEGPVGLCTGKRAINIATRGGLYSEGPGTDYEMGDRYLRTIMAFLGITDYETIFADGLDIIGNDVDAIMNAAIKAAREKARVF
jgi:FMN-dependent NADH-azoreductase